MSKRIGRLAAIFTAAFISLVINLTYLQFIAASSLTAKPENIRPILYEKRIERGKIISSDGVVLATSNKVSDGYERFYPEGETVSHITGFYSQKYGRSGLELIYDEYLSGQTRVSSISDYIKRLLGKEVPGNDLTLTINTDIQRAAMKALGNRKGAAVVLNPKTGAVLALASQPTYNPNDIDDNWKTISTNSDGAMLNRALQGRFTPGSSFKVVTASAAIEENLVSTDTVFSAPARLSVYGGKVSNYGGKDYGKATVEDAFSQSINTVFAQIGLKLGGAKLVDYAKAFGLNISIPFDLPTSEGWIPAASDMDKLEVAWTAVGQGRTLVTPLNMALICSAIANDGKLMRPYLVEKISEHNGNTIFKHRPSLWRQPISKDTAVVIKLFMEKTVDMGTGTRARIGSIRVAGKTGTAEVSNKEPHAWFVGFAPVEDPQVAVAVIIENGGSGGRVAAPIAREILATALGKNR
ncbi:MAG: penicillin-binding transpeptidase domain-containing protein [Actinomycetota bacterium]